MPRASGKTTLLIKESAKTGKPIITANCFAADNIRQMAKDMGVDIPKPMSATNWLSGCCRDGRFNRVDSILIDELDAVLRSIFGGSIDKVTYTPEKIGMSKAYDGKKNVADFEEMLNNFKIALDRLDKRLNEMIEHNEKKEKKMSKFKIGDIVKIKPVEQMEKSSMMDEGMKKYALSHHTIRFTRYDMDKDMYTYTLDGCGEYVFDESMLEDRVYTEDDIFNINVIVPDKVVEIEFYDSKEKMVCHEDDTFDLRKCCFIAIAKHLYKKDYTYEGIEYMAEQLKYQKKYVKIVDKALKDYRKKGEEKAERIRKEEEEKIVRARQSLKRRKQKARRAQRHKEVLVDVFADSINEAKARRKKEKK